MADMTAEETTSVAVWFLVSEEGEPLGRIHRQGEEAIPTLGTRLMNGAKWKSAEVIEFTELTATCAVRRFQSVSAGRGLKPTQGFRRCSIPMCY